MTVGAKCATLPDMSSISPLRDYRLRSSITLAQFGARLGVNKTTVLRWEAGRPPAERAVDIERATNGELPRHVLRPDLFAPPCEATTT